MDKANTSTRKQIRFKRVFGKKMLGKANSPNSILLKTFDSLETIQTARETVNSSTQI